MSPRWSWSCPRRAEALKGVALGADAEVARLKLEDGSELTLPRGNIRKAKLVLTDELIAATAADAKRN
jgi:ribosome maturation factor RimP